MFIGYDTQTFNAFLFHLCKAADWISLWHVRSRLCIAFWRNYGFYGYFRPNFFFGSLIIFSAPFFYYFFSWHCVAIRYIDIIRAILRTKPQARLIMYRWTPFTFHGRRNCCDSNLAWVLMVFSFQYGLGGILKEAFYGCHCCVSWLRFSRKRHWYHSMHLMPLAFLFFSFFFTLSFLVLFWYQIPYICFWFWSAPFYWVPIWGG